MTRGHEAPVWMVTWAPDARHLASASEDGTVRVWDSAGCDERYVLAGHSDSVWSATWSPDGSFLLSGSEDGCACLWDASSGRVDAASDPRRAGGALVQ